METNQKITFGLIGVLTLIVSAMGGNMYLSPDQLDNAFICSVNENVVLGVDHLSSTTKTAYWIDENGEEQSKVCRGGFWLDLRQFTKDNNIELNILLQNTNKEVVIPIQTEGKRWECSTTNGCISLN